MASCYSAKQRVEVLEMAETRPAEQIKKLEQLVNDLHPSGTLYQEGFGAFQLYNEEDCKTLERYFLGQTSAPPMYHKNEIDVRLQMKSYQEAQKDLSLKENQFLQPNNQQILQIQQIVTKQVTFELEEEEK